MTNSKFRFHHLGIAVENLQNAIPIYKNLFGYELMSGTFDDPIQKVSVCFISRGGGDPVLELVAPNAPDAPIVKILSRGGSAYHICYEVTDIQAALEHLKANKCAVLSTPVPAVAFNQRMIAWLSAPTRQLIELVEA